MSYLLDHLLCEAQNNGMKHNVRTLADTTYEEDARVSIQERLQKLKLLYGLKQSEVARFMGLNAGSLNAYVNHGRPLSMSSFGLLMDTLYPISNGREFTLDEIVNHIRSCNQSV